MQSLRDAVYNQGIGFLIGRRQVDSFGPGGYHRTAVEEPLPVDMDHPAEKKFLPKGRVG